MPHHDLRPGVWVEEPTGEGTFRCGQRTIDDFSIQGEAGRGAYGLVKRVREKRSVSETSGEDLGPPLIMKQVIKSRILADCWKKHPVLGTIPIEIYVMSALSSTSYVLPSRRPWDPLRFKYWEAEGAIHHGHPSIIPLLDFFEDAHYYYLILPAAKPSFPPFPSPFPSDLFDLVERYPMGLPASLIRSYLGQIADALAFLHARGICHRDIKDENVVLGRRRGIVKKEGWDTFSGTLDYAGPEILRGERYAGPPQDVWAFGIVSYVLVTGECPFSTASEAAAGLAPNSKALLALEERSEEGREEDGGGRLGDAAALIKACLQVDISRRPTFETVLSCRYLSGSNGWVDLDEVQGAA
ncbi:hypothetical protein BS47DRAFT_1372771 [Hydnum rufescens UP504]|uniref:Protein kinase domain-containing protein n=1 Tax=Hydnum rufescens UP504 TaxID=1448309 RepID=A0A9P6AVU7_9AGAM|nr:hypothetical protein BS47DRAFT_1372771 [Hydnum rufescens UP504]